MRKTLFATSLLLLFACATTRTESAGKDAISVIVGLLDRYDVVIVPEAHRAREVHDVLRGIVADPRLAEKANDIAVEFGNARFQGVADRYLLDLEDVSADERRKIWRDTGQFLVWDSPLYDQFFEAVRTRNERLPRERRIRVVLGDPPIPWESVHTKADYQQYADRDLFFAGVVEREILARGRKAILIVGNVHVTYGAPRDKDLPDRRRNVADLLHRRFGDRIFSIAQVREPLPTGVEPPLLRIAKGTPLGEQSFAPYAPKGLLIRKIVNGETQWVPVPESDWPAISVMTDALLNYGPTMTEVEAERGTYEDAARVAELRRRARIMSEVYGFNFEEQLDEAVKNTR